MVLEIEVHFNAGYFHGREWPPAPARLFQALIAATHHGAHGLINAEKRDAALRWLEALPAPVILAAPAEQGCGHLNNFVPNNDDEFGLNAHVRTAKSLAVHALPSGSVVTYYWTFAPEKEAEHQAGAVAAMAFLVTKLGATADSVFARGRTISGPPKMEVGGRTVYLPHEEKGGRWMSPAPGFLKLCQERYPRSVSSQPPGPTNSRQIEYHPAGQRRAAGPPVAIYEMRRNNGGWLHYEPYRIREAAGMVRHALLEWMEKVNAKRHFSADLLSRLLGGHRAAGDSAPSAANGHFGVAPLPSLYPDGQFRRVAVIGWGADTKEGMELFKEATRGLHEAPLMQARKSGESADDPSRGGNASTQERGVAVGRLLRLDGAEAERQLADWTRPGRHWRTVTPIVLPGMLRPGRAAEELVARAVQQAGIALEDVKSIAAYRGPIVPRTLHAGDYRIANGDYLDKALRFHAEIIFEREMVGPLVFGRGRYTGLGLCLPVGENAF